MKIQTTSCKHARATVSNRLLTRSGKTCLLHMCTDPLPLTFYISSIRVLSNISFAYGAAKIDARCRRLPPNYNIRIFMNGISQLNCVTGSEHDNICRFLLGLIINIPLDTQSHNVRVVWATRAILEFLYLAQYPVHTEETLGYLEVALQRFHDNKEVFIQLGIRDHFNIPKVHFMLHYVQSIKLFGTLDNFNMEYTEQLHIDLAKDAYRATNKKDEYSQMTLWLERCEKIFHHANYIAWCRSGSPAPKQVEWTPPGLQLDCELKLTKYASANVHIINLLPVYGIQYFSVALACFIALTNNSHLAVWELEDIAATMNIPFGSVPVWHRVKYVREDPVTGTISTADSLYVQPAQRAKCGVVIPARFDTALINNGSGGYTGVSGTFPFSLLDNTNRSVKVIVLAKFDWFFPSHSKLSHLYSSMVWNCLNI